MASNGWNGGRWLERARNIEKYLKCVEWLKKAEKG